MKRRIFCFLVIIPMLASCKTDANVNLLHTPIQNTKSQYLSKDIVSRTAYKAIEDLAPYFMNSTASKNYVLSPSSYLLAVAGLASATDNFNNSSFGLENNALLDAETLLNGWNFGYKNDDSARYFRSAILHQQIGEGYAFDDEKRETFNQQHISTMVSDIDNYAFDAQYFFKEKIGLTLDIPSGSFPGSSGIITYGDLKMKDTITNGLHSEDNQFTNASGQTTTVSTYSFGSMEWPKTLTYYKGDNYQAFKVGISYTDLLIVLPDENIDVSTINVAEAYQNYTDNRKSAPAYGYIPYFHARTGGESLTESLTKKLSGEEAFYSKLLKDDVVNDLEVVSVMQSSDFKFDKYGVSGESITQTVIGAAGPMDGTPIELNVNRPFYAISLKDNFPLFVSKVVNP